MDNILEEMGGVGRHTQTRKCTIVAINEINAFNELLANLLQPITDLKDMSMETFSY